jgi:hypothetical protein
VSVNRLPPSRTPVEVDNGLDLGRLIDTQLAGLVELALLAGAEPLDLSRRLLAAGDFVGDLRVDLLPEPSGTAPF